MPPSHTLSSGPKTVALQTNKFSSDVGLALHPSGGSWVIALRSDSNLSDAALQDPIRVPSNVYRSAHDRPIVLCAPSSRDECGYFSGGPPVTFPSELRHHPVADLAAYSGGVASHSILAKSAQASIKIEDIRLNIFISVNLNFFC